MKIAVIGATGAVGREMLRILEERRFPVDELVLLASTRSAGRLVEFAGEEHEVRELSIEAARGADVAFVSAGASTSKAFLPDIASNGRSASTTRVPSAWTPTCRSRCPR